MGRKVNISIITVCLNSEKTISKAIESVLSQQFSGLEYIIVDGGSTDRTLEIVEKYKAQHSGVAFKIISEPDDGIYDAMNKGIRQAQGELVGIINSDDWYEPGCFRIVWDEYQKQTDKKTILYGAMNIYRDGKLKEILFSSHEFLREKMITHPTCFVAKVVYESIGGFNIKYRLAADYDFLLLAYDKNINFVGIKHVLANFAIGGASISKKLEKEEIRIQYRHGIHSKVEYISRMCIYYIKLGLFNIKQLVRKATGTGK